MEKSNINTRFHICKEPLLGTYPLPDLYRQGGEQVDERQSIFMG